MAYSYVTYVADGTNKTYSVPFPYLDKAHVHAYVNGVEDTTKTWPTDSTISLTNIPVAGATVKISRITPLAQRLVDFQNVSLLKEKDLDRNSDQLLFVTQEREDNAQTTLVLSPTDNNFDAQNRGIKNVASPVNDADVVTKGFISPYVNQAATSASNAATSETNAAASATKAGKWAEEAENVEVESGKYSAKHHALKAAASANSIAAAQAQINEPFYLKSAIYDSVGNKIDLTFGPGRAAFLGTLVAKTADSTYSISAPTINTTYYVYLKSDGTYTHNTTGAEIAGAVQIWAVATGATVDAITKTDRRGQLPTPITDGWAPGDIKLSASITPSPGWLECNGAAVSRTTYAALFAAIGTTFGAGDGSTTFNLPDLRGEFVRGWDHGRGVDSGRTFGSVQSDGFKSHNHELPGGWYGYTTATGYTLPGQASTGMIYNSTGTLSTGGSETRPRNVALMYCIKY